MFLKDAGLQMYTAELLRQGFDDLETLAGVSDTDLESLGVLPHHARLLHRKLMLLRGGAEEQQQADDANPVAVFLREVGLEQYTTTLLEHGFDDMETLLLIDDVDLKDLGVRLGHVVKLKKRLREHELRLAGQAAAPLPAPKAEAAAGALPSASGLSEVERSWDQVQAHGVNVVGGLLYRNFFKLAPEAVALYPAGVRLKYSEWTVDEESTPVLQSAALRKLFGRIINAIGCTVVGFQDVTRVVPMLERLGSRHSNYRVGQHLYTILGKALEMTLAELLGPAFTPEVKQNWAMVYAFMTAVMLEGHRHEIVRKASVSSVETQLLAGARMVSQGSTSTYSTGIASA